MNTNAPPAIEINPEDTEQIAFLAIWGGHDTEACNEYIARSQGLPKDEAQAILLLRLVRSIAARKDWEFNLHLVHHSADGSPYFEVWVFRPEDYDPHVGTDNDLADALLSAYAHALEAQEAA
jgi:hypothetical protein